MGLSAVPWSVRQSVSHAKWSDLLQIKIKMFLDGLSIAPLHFDLKGKTSTSRTQNAEIVILSLILLQIVRFIQENAKMYLVCSFIARYILAKVKVRGQRQGRENAEIVLFRRQLHRMVRVTSSTDHSVPIPRRVRLLCLALQILLFATVLLTSFIRCLIADRT